MSQLSDAVRALEVRNFNLSNENADLRERVRAMERNAGGNVLLVRHDGYSRAMTLDLPRVGHLGVPYSEAERESCLWMPRRIEACESTRRIDFLPTRERDVFGRIIYREA